eukprot:15127-Pelagococcus_subviridis.AAC.1
MRSSRAGRASWTTRASAAASAAATASFNSYRLDSYRTATPRDERTSDCRTVGYYYQIEK